MALMTPQSLSHRVLFPLLAVIVAFVGSTLYAEWSTVRIDEDAEALTSNALPSVAHLSVAIGALHRIELASDAYSSSNATDQARQRDEIQEARYALATELALYAKLPTVPGERQLFDAASADLRELEPQVDHLFHLVDIKDPAGARSYTDHEIRRTVVRVGQNLEELVGVNLNRGEQLSRHITEIRKISSRLALVLDSLSVVFALAAGMLTWRAVRSYLELLDTHRRIESERAAELELFAKRVAHDLLSPLSSLSFCIGMLRKLVGDRADVEDFLARAANCLARTRRLTDGIFSFARAGALPDQSAHAQLSPIVDELVRDARAATDGVPPLVEVDVPAHLEVACGAGVLTSLLSNLLENALKYTKDCALRRIVVSARTVGGDGRVRVEVSDTGPGLPEGLEARVFEPYVRAAGVTQPGLGLGLATVKRLCEAYGGRVGVHSELGQGSVFWFELPRWEAARHPQASLATQPA